MNDEDRLKGYKTIEIDLSKVENRTLTDADLAAIEKASDEATKKANSSAEWLKVFFAGAGKLLGIAAKAAIVAMLCLALTGCFATPPEVTAANDASASQVVHFAKNCDAINDAWAAAYRAADQRYIDRIYEGAVAENTDQNGRILVTKVSELIEAKRAAEAARDAEIAKVYARYADIRQEALGAVRLNAAVSRWLARKVLTADDVSDLVSLASEMAAQTITAAKAK